MNRKILPIILIIFLTAGSKPAVFAGETAENADALSGSAEIINTISGGVDYSLTDTQGTGSDPETAQEKENEVSEASEESEIADQTNAAPAERSDAEPAEPPEPAEEEDILLTEQTVTDTTEKISVVYNTHVQTYGWMKDKADGAVSGTTGESKRLEAIKIRIAGDADLGLTYQTHVQTYGWMGWVSANAISGTEGKSKRLEAIRIRLTGKDKDQYDIYYSVHVQTYGWMNWVKNGELAGTEGQSKRLEGICIMLVKKGDPVPLYPGSSETGNQKPAVSYRVHAQTYGWMNTVKDGASAGTQGESKRLESFVINLENVPYSGSVQYRAHVQSFGWEQDWHNAGEESGTTGLAKRLEAFQIRLTGEMAEHFDIYYRTHVQRMGWLGWAKNGEKAGSEGFAYRMEAMQIRLVPKGAAAPGTTQDAFRSFTPPELESIDAADGGKKITVFGGYTLNKNLQTQLQKAIDTAKQGDLNVGFIMMDIRTGQGVAYNADERFYGASTIKAFYVPAVVYSDPASVAKWEQHMKGILEQSNNYSYELLRQAYGSAPIQAWAARAGISDEGINSKLYTWYSARTLAKLWLVNYSWFQSGGEAQKVVSWLQNPNQSVIRSVLGKKYTIYSKGGWKSSPEKCFNDAGIVYAGNGPYVIALMSDYPGMREQGLYGIAEALDACHSAIR